MQYYDFITGEIVNGAIDESIIEEVIKVANERLTDVGYLTCDEVMGELYNKLGFQTILTNGRQIKYLLLF